MKTSRLRYVWILVMLGSLLLFQPNANPAPAVQANNGNVLVNGDFEVEDPATHGFIWFPPNHFLALNWYRWWVNMPAANTMIPEYDDMRPGTLRWPPYSGRHAQVYFKWGANYQAGIYQVVENLTPCVPYEFSMYVNSHGNAGTVPHTRIGLDPQGTQITRDHVYNDLIGGQMPPLTAWSAEQTILTTWERLATTAEPLGTRLTAITYANPSYTGDQDAWYDTWWDNGALVQVGFPNGKLPEPASWNSPYIEPASVQSAFSGDNLLLSWNTTVPASTQAWYQTMHSTAPITTTAPMSHTMFLPLIMRADIWHATALNPTPTTNHSVSIPGMQSLQSGDKVIVRLLSRRPATDACVTEGYGNIEIVKP